MTETLQVPTVNRELFTKIRDHIKAHPEQHDNYEWEIETEECGTARCAAGWAIYFTHPGRRIRQTVGDEPAYRGRSFNQIGRELLGLTSDEADELFYTSNRSALEMIEHFAANGREDWNGVEYDD